MSDNKISTTFHPEFHNNNDEDLFNFKGLPKQDNDPYENHANFKNVAQTAAYSIIDVFNTNNTFFFVYTYFIVNSISLLLK